MRYEMILNPKAGKEKVRALLTILQKELGDIPVHLTRKKGDASIFAKKASADILLVAGGDGTINEVVNGILRKKKRPSLALIPFGTANILAKELGICTIRQAIFALKKQKAIPLDVGLINGRAFLNAAGVGADALMFKRVPKEWKKYLGTAAYSIAAIPALLRYRPRLITVHAKGISAKGYYVMICNVGRYGPFLHVAPKSRLDDGKLDVLVFRNSRLRDVLRYLLGIALRSEMILADVVRFQTDKLTLCARDVPLHTDAESIGTTPAKVRILPRAIHIFRA